MTQDEIEARGEFTPRTQGEIDRNLFAARTGGLVNLSGAAFWEMYYAAQAWHRHAKAQAEARAVCNPHPDAPHGFNRNASHNAGRYVCDCEGWAPEADEPREVDELAAVLLAQSSPLAPQARDTTPSEDA